MRIYDIALFLFIFNLSLGILNGLEIGLAYSTQPVENMGYDKVVEYRDEATATLNDEGGGILNDAVNFITESVRLVVVGVPLIMRAIWDASIGFNTVLQNVLGVPSVLATPLWIIVNFIYFIGMIQLVTGRNIKEYQ